jgi:tetratricopeptide (TPR) repeat protein
MSQKRIFVSATSRDLRTYRELASRSLRKRGYEVDDQAIFDLTFLEIGPMLKQRIAACNAVICLIGFTYGGEPSNRPPDAPRRSYTQWEYQFARELDKPVYLLLAGDDTKFDANEHPPESDELRQLQKEYRAEAIRDRDWRSFNSIDQLRAEVAELRFPWESSPPDHKPSNLPFQSIGHLFKGRDEFLDQIRAVLGPVAGHHGHRRVAAITAAAATVYGLGGIGKTRAAIEYAHRHAGDFAALLFVRADSPSSLQQNLAALCGPLVLDLPEQAVPETEKQVTAVLAWLQRHPGWFLIFDNVDSEPAAQAVEALLSQLSPAGQVLITSRLSGWSGAVETLALDVLAESDAAAFLLERTDARRRKQPDDPKQARRLAVELGQLALALEQAAAYIAKHRLTFAQYLDRWRTKHEEVLAWFDERRMQYPLSVAITWQTSFDQLTASGRDMLNLLAWFAPAPIPESLLEAGNGPWGNAASDDAVGLADPHNALADLEAYSLVTRAAGSPTFSVHRLVADVARRNMRGDTGSSALRRALRWLDDAFVGNPQDVRDWPTLDPLAPHAHAVATYADRAGIAAPTARLFRMLGSLMHHKAQYTEAEPLKRRALAIDGQSYGNEHSEVAIHLANLAQLLQATNRLAEAEPLMRRALDIDEKSYGTEHPRVATELNNLAALLQATNRLAEAEPLMRRALAIDEKSYGKDHPNVAIGLNNLANLLQATNRLAEAEPLMRRTLAIDEKSYGKGHPVVARDLNNLALLLHDTNRLADAEPLMRRALEIFARFNLTTGHEHPQFRAAVANYRGLLEAMSLSEIEIVAKVREVLGPDLRRLSGMFP